MEKRKQQVRVSSPRGGAGENPVDDGHSWRKYGQKEILGAKHPRLVCWCSFPYISRSSICTCACVSRMVNSQFHHKKFLIFLRDEQDIYTIAA